MSTRRSRKPGPGTYLKDVLSYLGGWGLIVHQVAFVPRGDFNLWALLLGGLLIGVPGLGQLTPFLAQALARWLTGQLPSAPPEEDSSPRPSSSSRDSGADR